MLGLIGLQFIRDDMDQRRRGDHADLDASGRMSSKTASSSAARNSGVASCTMRTLRVLRCQRRDGAHAVDTVGQHRLEIRLHAGAARSNRCPAIVSTSS